MLAYLDIGTKGGGIGFRLKVVLVRALLFPKLLLPMHSIW